MQNSNSKLATADGGPLTVPPFAATCRAEPIVGTGAYSRCLVDENIICCYRGTLFNLGHFCLHPRHLEIVARTVGKRVVPAGPDR